MSAENVPVEPSADIDVIPEYQEIPRTSITFDRDGDGEKILLGEGGFGDVYKGKYDKLGCNEVAIKQIKHTRGGLNPRDKKQLQQEAKNMYQIRNQYIVTIYGIVCDDSLPNNQLFAIITEYMERGSLHNFMEKIRIPWPVKVRMLKDVSTGLTYLHNKQYRIIHGDIKSANILIGMNFNAKIADFGSSKLQGITSRTTKIAYKNTVTHVAPEILDVKLNDYGEPDELSRPSEFSDVYSFGMTIFEVCAEPNDKDDVDPLYRVPFPSRFTDQQLYSLIKRDMRSLFTPKQREKIPKDCPQFLYDLSESCCRVNWEQRPRTEVVQGTLHREFELGYQQNYHEAMKELFEITKLTEQMGQQLHQSQSQERQHVYQLKHKNEQPTRAVSQPSNFPHPNSSNTSKVYNIPAKSPAYQPGVPEDLGPKIAEEKTGQLQLSTTGQFQLPVTKEDLRRLETMLTRISEQQMVLSDQSYIQNKVLSAQIHLSGDASKYPLKCKHPVLAECQEQLLEFMCPSLELTNHLYTNSVMNYDEKTMIEADKTEMCKKKRILIIVDSNPDEIPVFIQSLKDSLSSKRNLAMAKMLQEKYDEYSQNKQDVS